MGGTEEYAIAMIRYLRRLEEIAAADPYVTAGVAEYETVVWRPIMGEEALER